MFISNNSIVLSSKKEDVKITGFEFQKLPYSYDFLEPVIDEETVDGKKTKRATGEFKQRVVKLDDTRIAKIASKYKDASTTQIKSWLESGNVNAPFTLVKYTQDVIDAKNKENQN